MDQISSTCCRSLGVKESEIEIFALVPLSSHLLQDQQSQQFEIGVRMNSPSFSNLTLRHVENNMIEKQRCQNLLKSSNEALVTFTTELKRIKKVLLAAVLPEGDVDSTRMNSNDGGNSQQHAAGNNSINNGSGSNQNMDTLLKRLMKFKHLEDDNKKLKNLLKDQLEKSELLRQETQSTVETLREEFAELVEELVQYKNKEAAAMHPDSVASGNFTLQNTFGANENKPQTNKPAPPQNKPASFAVPKLKLGQK